MTEADILATTYFDLVTVYRPFKEVLESGESVFKSGEEGRKVYEDIKCALSTKTGGKLFQSNSVAVIDADYILFVRPEVEIEPNDFLIVKVKNKEIKLIAGKIDYKESHNNIPVRLADSVV